MINGVLGRDSDAMKPLENGQILALFISVAVFCLIFVAFLVCVTRLSKYMKLTLNYLRAQHRRYKALQEYKYENINL